MMTKEELLLKRLNDKYQAVEQVLQSVPKASEDSLRSILEACVKLVWLIKFQKDPDSKDFSLAAVIQRSEFTKLFTPLIISDMNIIKDLGNDSIHNNVTKHVEGLTANELIELFERLKKIIRETEKVLGFSIINLIQENVESRDKEVSVTIKESEMLPNLELLNRRIKHPLYGEGKIIGVSSRKITIQFQRKRKEFSITDIKPNFLQLLDEQQPTVESTTIQTYTPNIPEVKQVNPTCVIKEHNESPIKSISKFDAIRLFKNSGLNILSKNCTFATKNSMSYLYWANPKTDLLEDDWWLILNDNINYKIHIFKIPANSLDVDMIKVRADKPYLIDLQILFDDDLFTDTRSNIQFAKWYIKTLTY